MKIKLFCYTCKKEFYIEKSNYNQNKKRGYTKSFCSSTCRDIDNKTGYNLTCKSCGNNIYIIKNKYDKSITKNFFCSRSCSISYSNKHKKRNPKKLNKCQTCGKNTVNKKFCSDYCYKNRNDNYLDSCFREKKSIELSTCEAYNRRRIKRYLIKKYGANSSICKNHKWMGKVIPLVLDHIDGDASNNNILNLRLVCGNCNMQLPTFAGKNRGRGTRSKIQRN